MIEIYTDGSFQKSKGQGGFGVVILDKENDTIKLVHAYQEQFQDTSITNNQMELSAIKYACEYILSHYSEQEQANIIIYSDSEYCVKSINEWMPAWKRKNWINSKKEQVKNLSLIQILYHFFYEKSNFFVPIKWIKGHDYSAGNELADALATHNIKKFIKMLNEFSILY